MARTSWIIRTLLLISSWPAPAGTLSQAIGIQRTRIQLNVRVYSFPALSSHVLDGVEIEAGRLLHSAHLEFNWIDCTSSVLSDYCLSTPSPADLIVRFLPKALVQVDTNALGMATVLGEHGTALIFYDRVAALRTGTRVLSTMLGRVTAHEIVHTLLPEEGHSGFGLMRPQWSANDLEFDSQACIGLSSRSIQLMQKEALRRLRVGESTH